MYWDEKSRDRPMVVLRSLPSKLFPFSYFSKESRHVRSAASGNQVFFFDAATIILNSLELTCILVPTYDVLDIPIIILHIKRLRTTKQFISEK